MACKCGGTCSRCMREGGQATTNKQNVCNNGSRCPCEWGLHICPEDMCCDYNYLFGGGCHELGGGIYFGEYSSEHSQYICTDSTPPPPGPGTKIRKTRKPNQTRQSGGLLIGPSHEQGGMGAIIEGGEEIELEGGEYIINAQTVDALGVPFLDELNSTQTTYHTGGFGPGELPSPSHYKDGGRINRRNKMSRGRRNKPGNGGGRSCFGMPASSCNGTPSCEWCASGECAPAGTCNPDYYHNRPTYRDGGSSRRGIRGRNVRKGDGTSWPTPITPPPPQMAIANYNNMSIQQLINAVMYECPLIWNIDTADPFSSYDNLLSTLARCPDGGAVSVLEDHLVNDPNPNGWAETCCFIVSVLDAITSVFGGTNCCDVASGTTGPGEGGGGEGGGNQGGGDQGGGRRGGRITKYGRGGGTPRGTTKGMHRNGGIFGPPKRGKV